MEEEQFINQNYELDLNNHEENKGRTLQNFEDDDFFYEEMEEEII